MLNGGLPNEPLDVSAVIVRKDEALLYENGKTKPLAED